METEYVYDGIKWKGYGNGGNRHVIDEIGWKNMEI
jgi:hypothetical protein